VVLSLHSCRVSLLLVTVAVAFLSVGCTGVPAFDPPPPPPPGSSITISTVAPATVTRNGSDFSLTVHGSGFVNGSVVQWNRVARVTTFVSSTELRAAILATDLQAAGVAEITVQNPAPSSGLSNAVNVTVENPVPTITSVDPNSVVVATSGVTFTLNGSNFFATPQAPETRVRWNGVDVNNLFIQSFSSTSLRVFLPAEQISRLGQGSFTLVNGGPGGGISNSANVDILPVNPAFPQLLVNALPDGRPSNSAMTGAGLFTGRLSFDGRYVLFTAGGTGLHPQEIPTTPFPFPLNVYVRDTCVVGGCAPATLLASIEPNGSPIRAVDVGISETGRFVAFYTEEVPRVLRLRDTCIGTPAGCSPSTNAQVLVSITGGEPTTEQSCSFGDALISANARYVAFESTCKNLIPNDSRLLGNVSQVFIADTCTNAPAGCTRFNALVSRLDDGTQSSTESYELRAISPDGRFVAYSSVLRDTCLGAPAGCTPTNIQLPELVSAITPGARFVVFGSESQCSPGCVPNPPTLRDTCFGAPAGCVTSDVNIAPGANDTVFVRGISDDGRFIVFFSGATNLVPDDTNLWSDVFLRDQCTGAPAGCVPQTLRLNVSVEGNQANSFSLNPQISRDGRFITYSTSANNLLSNDSPNGGDVLMVRNPLIP
jgi:hypothetical protein